MRTTPGAISLKPGKILGLTLKFASKDKDKTMIKTNNSSSHVHKWDMIPTLIILVIFCFQIFIGPKLNFALGSGSPVAEQLYYLSFLAFVFFWTCSIVLFVLQVIKLTWSLHNKRRALCVDRIIGLTLFSLVLVIAGHFDYRCSESLLDGFAQRLDQKADIQAIQNWADDFVRSAMMTNNVETVVELDIRSYKPSCIHALNPTYFRLFAMSSGSYVLRIYFGGPIFSRWGVDIVDSDVPQSIFEKFELLETPQYRHEWKPNIYLWHQLDD